VRGVASRDARQGAANETISPSSDGAAVVVAPRSGSKFDELGPTPVKRERLPPFPREGIRGMVGGDVRLKSDEPYLFPLFAPFVTKP